MSIAALLTSEYLPSGSESNDDPFSDDSIISTTSQYHHLNQMQKKLFKLIRHVTRAKLCGVKQGNPNPANNSSYNLKQVKLL